MNDLLDPPVVAENPLVAIQKLSLPDVAGQTLGAHAALRMVGAFVIESRDDYLIADEEMKSAKRRWKGLEDLRTSITGPINKGLDAINALFGGPQKLLKQTEDLWKAKMIAFDDEQERKENAARAEAERIAQVERDRLAAEERRIKAEADAAQKKRDDAEAERQRIAAAKQKEIDDAAALLRAAGDLAAAAKQEDESKRLREAAEADRAATQRANEQAAQETATQVAAVQMTADVTTAASVQAFRVRATGTSTRKAVAFHVTDLHKLVQHVALHPELLSLVTTDTVKLRAYVNGLGTNCNLPGVLVTEEKKMAARA